MKSLLTKIYPRAALGGIAEGLMLAGWLVLLIVFVDLLRISLFGGHGILDYVIGGL